jgi:hypothetical protein
LIKARPNSRAFFVDVIRTINSDEAQAESQGASGRFRCLFVALFDDAAFDALKLKMTIVPGQANWPRTETLHMQKLVSAADKARELVRTAFEMMAAVEADKDLSPQGRDRQRRKIGTQAMVDFHSANELLERARAGVAHQMAKWEEMVGLSIKAASNIHEASIYSQVRDRLYGMKNGQDPMRVLEKYGDDPVIASAVLTAPLMLSGLSDAEIALVRHKVESHVDPAIIAARDATAKALQELEQGWQRAQDVIGQRAGLVKGADGSWGEPANADAAA